MLILNRHVLVLCLWLLSAASPTFAATFDYTTIYAHLSDRINNFYSYGGMVDLALKGNIAYTIDDHEGLQIVDCADPLNFSYRGYTHINDAYPKRGDVWNHYVYIIDDQNRLSVIDVDDHDNPMLINQLDVGTSLDDLLVVGPWLYVTLSNSSLQVYSLASAESPILVNTLVLPSQHGRRLAWDNDRVIAAGNGGIVVIDPAVPGWPSVMGSYAFDGFTTNLSVRNGLAVVGQSDQSRLLDISDPGNIFETFLFSDPGHGVLLTSNNQVWLGREHCWHEGSTRIYDISDPSTPVWLHDEVEGFRGAPRVMVESQGLIYAAEHVTYCYGEWAGFHVFQVGDLPLPDPLALVSLDGGFGMLRHGSLIDLATRQGIVSLDVSNPFAPQTVEIFDPDFGYGHLIEENSLIVTARIRYNYNTWFQVLTRDAEGQLERRGNILMNKYPQGIDLEGSLALACFDNSNNGGGLLAFDVSDPDSPEIVAELFVGENVRSIALHGNLAAIWISGNTCLYDLSDLANPLLLSSWESGLYYYPQHHQLIERNGHLLLLASANAYDHDYNGGLAEIYDVTEPANPVCLLSLRRPGMDMVGPLILEGNLIVVPGSNHMSFYEWPALGEPAEYRGQLQFPDEISSFWPTLALKTDQAVVTQNFAGTVCTWPLPSGLVSSVPDDGLVPAPSVLKISSFPNPFNPSCEIRFTLPIEGEVSVDIFDTHGRRVRSLLDAQVFAGNHTVRWNGRDEKGHSVAAGVYLARIRLGQDSTSVKLTLAK